MRSAGDLRRSLSQHLHATLWSAFSGAVAIAVWMSVLFSPLFAPVLGLPWFALMQIFVFALFCGFIILFVTILAVGAPLRSALVRSGLTGALAAGVTGAAIPALVAIVVISRPPSLMEWIAFWPVAGIGAVCAIVYQRSART